MALIPSSRYPAQTDTGDAGYPHGKARNSGSFQDGTGTPHNRDWINDLWGFLQALLDAAEITPSGTPDAVGASQYLDAVRAVAVEANVEPNDTDRLVEMRRSLILTPLGGVTLTDGGSDLGVCSAQAGRKVLLVKAGSGGVGIFTDVATSETPGSLASITSAVKKVIFGGTRHLAIGTGGVQNAYSSSNGSSWTAGGSTGLPAAAYDGVWDGTEFVISTTTGKAAHSTNGSSWSTATGGSDISDIFTGSSNGGLAALSDGTVVAAGSMADDSTAFAISTDHGGTWSAAGTIPDSATDYGTYNGYLAGNGGDEVYWIGAQTTASRLDLWVSSDGTTWTKRSEIPNVPPDFTPKLFVCQDTGLLVAYVSVNVAQAIMVSSDAGASWTAPVYYSTGTVIGVARGRIFATKSTSYFASSFIV